MNLDNNNLKEIYNNFQQKFPLIIESLKNAKANERLSHAYLVHSDDTEVRNNFTVLLAQIIACKELNNSPCGVCDNCIKFSKSTYTDLYTLEPISKSRQIVIGKDKDDPDTIRWFQSRFYLSSISGAGKKIGLIYDADRITVQGQNAFLKILEEPPKSTSFILASGKPGSLLPTVISRCQTIHILTNKCTYNFSDNTKLFELLLNIAVNRKGTLSAAVNASDEFIGMLANLRVEAENSVHVKWKKRLDSIENIEQNSIKNMILKRYEASIEAQYRLLREQFLNAVYSWFAQVFQIESGVEFQSLANPEVVTGYMQSTEKILEEEAYWFLNKTEKFIRNLKWNIDEKLAVQEFFINIVITRSGLTAENAK